MLTSRTDVVGSLLRPPELLKAREDVSAGTITPSEFKAIEDWAVDEAIALQRLPCPVPVFGPISGPQIIRQLPIQRWTASWQMWLKFCAMKSPN